jgi:beta-propeller repeat-containing protein
MRSRIGVVLMVFALAACGEPPSDTPDSGTPDAGMPDSGTPDSGTPDSGTPDSGTPDGGGDDTPRCVELPSDWTSDGLVWGTSMSEEVLAVAIDPKGNLYVGGYENGITGQANIDPSGDARGVLLKFGPDSTGGIIPYWQQNYDTAGADTIEALTFHPVTGALYFMGRTTGAFPGFTHKGQQDIFVGGPNSVSQMGVLYQGGTERPQHPRRFAFDALGDLVIAGYDDTYVPSNYVEAWEDPFVLKLHPDGSSMTEAWWWQFNTSGSDYVNGLAVDPRDTSGIYVTGAYLSGNQRGPFVKRLDAAGKELWNQRQTPVGVDMMMAAHVLPDGNVLVAGSTFATLGKVAYGQQDAVVRKLDKETGAPLWTYQFGSSETDWVTDMAVDAEGNIYLVGETLGAVDPAATPQGDYDVFLLKLDQSGNLLQIRQWGSAGDDHPASVAVDACGEAFIGGYTTGNLLGVTNSGGRDAFLLTTARPRGRTLKP